MGRRRNRLELWCLLVQAVKMTCAPWNGRMQFARQEILSSSVLLSFVNILQAPLKGEQCVGLSGSDASSLSGLFSEETFIEFYIPIPLPFFLLCDRCDAWWQMAVSRFRLRWLGKDLRSRAWRGVRFVHVNVFGASLFSVVSCMLVCFLGYRYLWSSFLWTVVSYSPLLMLHRLCASDRFCAVSVEVLFAASALRVPGVLFFGFHSFYWRSGVVFVCFVILFCMWNCSLLMSLAFPFSSFLWEVVGFQSFNYDGLLGFNLLLSSLRTLSLVEIWCCVVTSCLVDCAP